MPSESEVSNQDKRSELLKEFRQLTMLRATLASINSEGRQVVRPASPGPAILSLEKRQPPHRLAMNSVATLLIRQSEVVAVTTPANYDHVGDVSDPAETLDVLAMQETEQESTVNDLGIVEFAAIGNPESESVFTFGDGDEIVVVPHGKARWSRILQNPWEKIATRVR
jgi:hypothetical protein